MWIEIDPPSGWMYGFPKQLPDPPPENLREWLVSEGYPQALMDSFGEYFYCRYIQNSYGKLKDDEET